MARNPKTPPKPGKPGELTVNRQSQAVWAAVIIVAALAIYYSLNLGHPGAAQSNAQNKTVQPSSGTPAPLSLTVLSDKRCGQTCGYSQILADLKKGFPNLIVKELDYDTPEGKSLYDASGLTVLPAFMFDPSITGSGAYKNIMNYLDPAGDYLALRVNSPWDPYCDPTEEHCGEDKCVRRISCRQEMPGQLDIYTTSLSPSGAIAMDSMKSVLDTFKGEINFTVNYLGEFDANGVPSSPNGQREIGEDRMGLCAQKQYPATFMGYIWCRNRNLTDANLKGCAQDSGMDFEKLKACAEGDDGKRLLGESFKSSMQLGITSSPTFLVNNKRRLVNAAEAAQIQAGICTMNRGFVACKTNVTSASAPG
jgi:hypothetical protein